MSEVKRYDLVGDMDGNCKINEARMELSDDGVYVKHRDYEVLQAKCVALAAENAAFKDINAWCKTDAFSNMYREFKTAKAVGCCNIDCMHDAMVVAIMHAPEAPATDAFLNEVRAQGGAKALEDFAEFNIKSIDPFDDEYTEVLKETARAARCFAAQLRKGVEQK